MRNVPDDFALRSSPGVIWITGLSGAGKTTVATALTQKLRESFSTVLLDGDCLREVLDSSHCHEVEDRRKLALTYGRLARYLAEQGFVVVCATISMFHEVRAWNRANNSKYFEVYLRVPSHVLESRDSKGLYKSAAAARMVKLDEEFQEPLHADLMVDNYGATSSQEAVVTILRALREQSK